MKNKTIILSIACIIFSAFCYSQEKETVNKNGVDTQMTISETGMYGGTDSEKAKNFYNQAMEFDKKNDFNNAKKLYLKAIKEDSNYVEAYDNLGLVYRRLEDYDNAISFYKKSIEIYPDGQMAHQNLAAVYGLQENYESAIVEYHEILRISPNDPEGYFGIANSYMMLSQFDDALLNGNKALNLYKKTNSHHLADGYYMVGLIYYYKGDKKSAKENLQLAKDNGANIHPQIEAEFFN